MEIHVIDMTGDQPKEMNLQFPKLPAWTIAQDMGYEPKTTFWDDFSIADLYGPAAIVDTYRRAFKEWKDDVVYLTELSLVLNHKMFAWHNAAVAHGETDDHKGPLMRLRDLYSNIWQKVHDWACDNLKDDDYAYYFRVTD